MTDAREIIACAMDRRNSPGNPIRIGVAKTSPSLWAPNFAHKIQQFSVFWKQGAIIRAFFANKRHLPLDPSSQTDTDTDTNLPTRANSPVGDVQ